MLHLIAAFLLVAQAHEHGAADAHNPPAVSKDPKPKLHGSMIDLKVGGETSRAYVAKPKGAPKGGLLVLHEWWGLTDWIKHASDQLAGEGYLAIAVDLYKGKSSPDPKGAQALMQAKDEKFGDALEEAGIEWLKSQKAGKVATIGWCMGGGEALKAALNDPKDVDAVVMYYGFPVMDVEKLKTLKGPVLGLWANKDTFITPEKVAAFDKALTEAGVKHEFHAYDAEHGFANPSSMGNYGLGHYKSDAANDAWAKTKAFLEANLK
jgi:carboxymethylenebutenolidase